MNTSITNFTNFTIAQVDLLFQIPLAFDVFVRSFGVFLHLMFLVVLLFSKSLKKRTLLFANHATLVNAFYIIFMFSYIWNDHPSFQSDLLNEMLCVISEIGWIFSSYIRAYSMLLLAIYRYLATFKIHLFKKINESCLYLFGLICLVWIISLGMPIINKFSLGTRYSYIFCLDGWSPYISNMIIYYVITYVTVILIPTPIVVVIYIRITRKLNFLAAKTRGTNRERQQQVVTIQVNGLKEPNSKDDFELDDQDLTVYNQSISKSNKSDTNLASTDLNSRQNTPDLAKLSRKITKQKNFATQFIFMCFALVSSSFILSIFQLRSVISNYFQIFYYYRPFFRMYIDGVLCLVPIVSLYYHPSKSKFKRKLASLFKCTKS